MPAEPASSKTVKPQVTFKWDDAATWPALQKLAADRGYSSVNLFARHLCEEAIRGVTDEAAPRRAAGPDKAASVASEGRIAALADTIDGLRDDVQKLGHPDGEVGESLGRIRKSVRSLHETVKAELVQLRGDAADSLGRAGAEVHALRCNLADTFALLLVKVDPKVTPGDAKAWVMKNFFRGEG